MVVKRGLSKKLITLGVLSTLVVGSFAGMNQETVKANTEASPEIKNVIFLIGDGMGPSPITAHRYMKDDPSTPEMELTEFDKHLVGMQTTYPDDPAQNITDSASAATAMASGIKTYNNAIGMDPDKNPYETVLEQAKEDGKATGLVATSEITHATPASYGAHDESRKNMDAIADDYYDELVNGEHKIDVLLGGGSKNFIPEDGRKIDDRNLVEEFKNDGYSYVTTKDELLNDENEQVLGLFATGGLPKMIDRPDNIPSLEEMTQVAIDKLSKDDQGFFLMVEGSQIDWAEHDNDVVATMSEMEDFERAFKAAIDFAEADGQTLVVTTADHATGGLSLGANTKASPNGDYNFHVGPIKAFNKTPDYISAEIFAAGENADVEAILKKYIDSNFYKQISAEEIQAVKDAVAAKNATEIDNAIETIVDEHSVTGWTTGGHTGEDVPVYAFGPQKERFEGLIDNTDQAKIIFALLEENKMPNTAEPGDGTEEPGDGTEEPGHGTEEPGDGTEEPGDGTEEPGDGTEEPGDGTEKPGDGTEEPGDGTEKPGDVTEKPGDNTEKPGDDTTGPGNGTDEPKDGTDNQGDKKENPSNNSGGQKPSNDSKGIFNLPQTATNVYNLLIIGLVILAAGGGFILYQRKKAKAGA
ncbi:alkaline phosphatase [Metabacillus malikii]|uniref:Alkaline phosphatase n=2 Tax=Metabacillus malikii TaxID=1504265 RepID=A0ABT9ZIQ3_9BACI|nr:alkaline phosphatase [Metabacillus malikii]